MKLFQPYLLLTAICLLPAAIFGQNKKLSISKEPAWITSNTINYSNTKMDGEAEDGYVDIDYERQISLGEQSRYYKKAIKILSESGVQNSSEISVNYDPSYEQLSFHTVRILRDGKVLNKLQLSAFKTIQQEKDLSRHMYDGALTALLMLDDVRKGDVIEYSYTVRGMNPIFKGRYSDFYECRFGVPLGQLYYKLVLPAGRNITVKNSHTDLVAHVTKSNNETVYEWKTENVAALHLENRTPSWFDPYGTIMVSEFANWNEVSKWAAELFPPKQQLSGELQNKINSIRNSNQTDEQRILAALRFVQDDVRYMGIESGIGSHKPSDPDKIFNQRFGDCKDKSYLLSTMLKAMGIEATPILINTAYKRTINDWLPCASAFDHVTVQVKTGGKTYYFDPTISFQRGEINDISYPDYQVGLLIDPANTALTNIPFQEPGMADIKEVFDIPNMSGLAHFKVVTVNTGSFADQARSDFNNNSVYEIKKKYKDFYAAYFENITPDSLSYRDDEKTGAFVTTEYYTLHGIWKTEKGVQKSPFSPYIINSVMSKPADQNRTMPFSLVYPARYKEQIEINLPEEWSAEPFDDNIACAGFILKGKGYSAGNSVVLNYEYENLKDHVMPAEAATFFAKYDEADQATGYSLTYNAGSTSSNYTSTDLPSSTALGTFPKLYIILGLCTILTFLIRRQRQKEY